MNIEIKRIPNETDGSTEYLRFIIDGKIVRNSYTEGTLDFELSRRLTQTLCETSENGIFSAGKSSFYRACECEDELMIDLVFEGELAYPHTLTDFKCFTQELRRRIYLVDDEFRLVQRDRDADNSRNTYVQFSI